MPSAAGHRVQLTIAHPTGQTPRPSIKLTKGFNAKIRQRRLPHGDWLNVKSIAKVIALKPNQRRREVG